MRRFSLINRARWVGLAATLTVGASLFAGVSGAQAVVIDMNALGQPSVTYSSSDQSGYYGVALAPGTSLPNTVPTVTTAAPCTDPVLQPDLILKNTGLCSHGGAVIHNNETYALTWDPLRRYWATTRNYVEQFLGDVATGSGTFTSPYSVTTQYTDGTGHAANASVFAGGCIDYGNPGGYSCKFGSSNPSGIGSNYPASGCPVSGTDLWGPTPNGPLDTGASNDVCLTDAQIQSEL
ncbi:MAG: hypothetical protein JO262_15205, partial [Solirubrobacterales bacterium]|nr:hypothetical protein [Solirubrobacterales bacterium]